MKKHLRKIFLFLIPVFILAFNFQDNITSGWYFQSLPPLRGAQIMDITFTDSLTGYAVTNVDSFNVARIYKTTNGGDNWEIRYQNNMGFTKVQFINNLTGFVGSVKLMKTTDAGESWFELTKTASASIIDMTVLNENEIWITDPTAFIGGLYRSTNGGFNWQTMFFTTLRNPDKIYMYNSKLGFMQYSHKLYRTSDSGTNWDSVPGQNPFFFEIKMLDSLTGWKAAGDITKTTDGGLSWNSQALPFVSQFDAFLSLSIINKDTIWGCGARKYIPPNQFRAALYKTTNGGINWGYQLPDNDFNSRELSLIRFVNKNFGWVYSVDLSVGNYGFHTKIGGNDTTIYVGVKQSSLEVPDKFKLYQNYPNPFNPVTKINYEIKKSDFVTLKVYNINGKEISTLINQKQEAGTYEYTFNGSILSSGIYFYTLHTNSFTQTKKMILMK